ncbi:MAG: FliH/SctL family protein [Solidesulfovibrio sp. DCME]|uniref:FliH/SctL family protein n=1 Tax=Solidesulfovibrio sp. DCME TaxID=3447380 RepID=UPI003D0B8B80
MSLSDNAPGALTGRVILGPGGGAEAETTVSELESRRSPLHFEEVEAQFWERVRAKATAKASAIIAEAMAEGERLKAKAHEAGYAAGVAAAGEQIQAELSQMSTSLGSILQSLGAERQKLWDAHRQEFVALLRLALERTTLAAIDGRREEILRNILNESLDLMEAKAALTLVVHPDDEALVRELIARAATERGGLDRFMVRPDPALLPGSVILECADGLVDNSIGSRFAAVEEIFNQLAAAGDGGGGGA